MSEWVIPALLFLSLAWSTWSAIVVERRLRNAFLAECRATDERRAQRLAESDALAKKTLTQLENISHQLWEQAGARKGHWR